VEALWSHARSLAKGRLELLLEPTDAVIYKICTNGPIQK